MKNGRKRANLDDFSDIFFSLFVVLIASLLTAKNVANGEVSRRKIAEVPGWKTARHLMEDTPKITEEFTKGYMSNMELEHALKELNLKCRNISRIYSIGQSVNGFTMWVIEISNKPGMVEPKPAFKFIGNMHGDEPVGRELLIRLADWLCDNFMRDPLATFIVKNVHLHILPTMNPDGFTQRRRENANNVDLNRDFPDQFFSMNDAVDLRQPETKAVMDWIKGQHFTASASLHGGALVANYPWDGSPDSRKKYYPSPDDKTFRDMAKVYSFSHLNMSMSAEFPDGITNGAHWYPVYGGMQDWNYIHGGCFELTLEVSEIKWPKAAELDTLWMMNRVSMLNLIAWTVKAGLHGRIVSSSTGKPLPASVAIKGINYTVTARFQFGDYHRMLAPGQDYEVTASIIGYKPKTTRITLLEGEAMNLDFVLEPLEEMDGQAGPIQPLNCPCYSAGRLNPTDTSRYYHLALLPVPLIMLLLWGWKKRRQISKFIHRKHPRRPAQISYA